MRKIETIIDEAHRLERTLINFGGNEAVVQANGETWTTTDLWILMADLKELAKEKLEAVAT